MRKLRPYRSRKIPACSRCRSQKAKCTVDDIGRPCLLCQTRGLQCSAAVQSKAFSNRQSVDRAFSPFPSSNPAQTVDLHIVPPLVARDTQVLEEILVPIIKASTASSDARPRSRHHIPLHPVTIRRRSPAYCGCSQQLSQQLTRKVEPYFENMVQLYLDELHPCLPILDEKTLRSQLTTKQSHQTFLVTLQAYVLCYRALSSDLRQHALPDQDFAWQAACSAMDTDIHTSGILPIISAVLNISGRPSKGVVHNMSNVARIVALANSIGLNHDCGDWNMSEAEKRTRTKLWWAVLIHDRWFNFAQGTPHLINTAHYNVPVPEMSLLVEEMSNRSAIESARVYTAFCQLTEIVGEILPLVYHVRSGTTNLVTEQISASQQNLDNLIRGLDDVFQLRDYQKRPDVRGILNLQLAYLAVEMLLQRLAWHEHGRSNTMCDERLLRSCQRAAEKIAEFLYSLTDHELYDFWLPYNAQHFASAITLLLRCALQTTDASNRTACVIRAHSMIDQLRRYQREKDWDLAEIALGQNEALLQRIEDALPSLITRQQQQHQAEKIDNGPLHDERQQQQGSTSESGTGPTILNDHYDGDMIGDASLETLFPEIFTSFGDYAIFEQGFAWEDFTI